MQRKRAMKHKAFTLIEMLVVVSLIALLIALLMPSLRNAKKDATLTKCMSNANLIGQALSAYTVENESRLPYVGNLYSNQQMGYVHYWTEYYPNASRVHGFQNWGLLSKAGLMHHQSDLWFCPLQVDYNSGGNSSHANAVPGPKNTVLAPGDESIGWAHARVGYLRRMFDERGPYHGISLRRVGGRAFFSDWFSTPSQVATRHGDSVTVWYGDGGVAIRDWDFNAAPFDSVPNSYSQPWPTAQVYYDAVWDWFEQ